MMTKINNWMLAKQAELEVRRMETEEGQTMVEYGMVLVAVAVAAFVAYTALGGRVVAFLDSIVF